MVAEIPKLMVSHDQLRATIYRSLILVCVTTILTFESGIIKSFGVLLPTLREQLETKTWVIGLTISLIPGIGSLECLVLPRLRISGAYDPGYIIIVVGALTGIGLILASFCQRASIFAAAVVLQSVMALAKVTAFAILPDYFTGDSIAMANSVASCGMSFGIITMPSLTQFILDLYGWKGTLWLLGAVGFNYMVCGAWIWYCDRQPMKLNKHCNYQRIHDSVGSNMKTTKEKLGKSLCNSFNVNLLRNVRFLNVLILSISIGWTNTCWLIYLVPHAEEKGVKTSLAALMATIGGLGNILGKIAFVLCKKVCTNETLIYASCALCTLSLVVDPLLESYFSLTVSASLFAFGLGIAYMAGFAVMYNIVDSDMIVDAFAWFYVVFGVSAMIASFTTGFLFDYTNSYDAAFSIMGAFMFLPILSFGTERLLHRNDMQYSESE